MTPLTEPVNEDLPSTHGPHAVTIGACLFVVFVGALLASVLLLNQSSGTIADLRVQDALVVASIENDGVLVSDAMIECTFKPHVIVDVGWDAQSGQHFVAGLQLHCIEFSTISKALSRLSKLNTLIVPHATKSERQWIAAGHPHLQVLSLIHISEPTRPY